MVLPAVSLYKHDVLKHRNSVADTGVYVWSLDEHVSEASLDERHLKCNLDARNQYYPQVHHGMHVLEVVDPFPHDGDWLCGQLGWTPLSSYLGYMLTSSSIHSTLTYTHQMYVLNLLRGRKSPQGRKCIRQTAVHVCH